MCEENVRLVRLIGRQSGEDLYRKVNSKAVYVRQQCDDGHVRWLTSSAWSGGYEADCPMREGLVMKIINQSGDVLYEEALVKKEGYGGTVAEKKAPFSWEAIGELGVAVMTEFGLESYYAWKDWLMAEAEAAGYKGYRDNWLYDAEYEEAEKIRWANILGQKMCVIRQKATHRVCGKSWIGYEIRLADMIDCQALCGFELLK